MECGHCIFDRLRSEGMWDRFGTTFEQELEAMCMKHLIECEKFDRKWGTPEYIALADKYAKEIKRRNALLTQR